MKKILIILLTAALFATVAFFVFSSKSYILPGSSGNPLNMVQTVENRHNLRFLEFLL